MHATASGRWPTKRPGWCFYIVKKKKEEKWIQPCQKIEIMKNSLTKNEQNNERNNSIFNRKCYQNSCVFASNIHR